MFHIPELTKNNEDFVTSLYFTSELTKLVVHFWHVLKFKVLVLFLHSVHICQTYCLTDRKEISTALYYTRSTKIRMVTITPQRWLIFKTCLCIIQMLPVRNPCITRTMLQKCFIYQN
jgi:hypothetical protein